MMSNFPLLLMILRPCLNVHQDLGSQKTSISQSHSFQLTIHAVTNFSHTECVCLCCWMSCEPPFPLLTHTHLSASTSVVFILSPSFSVIHCVIRNVCIYVVYPLWVFSSWRPFFPILRVFLLSMGFSPGLCRASTDLNQLFLYM